MMKASAEVREAYVNFKTNNWCMVAGCTNNKERQSLETVIQIEDNGSMLFKSID